MALLAGFGLFGCGQLTAQTTTGAVVGVVYDSSGAVIPDCKITAVDIATGASHEAESNASGYYTIPSLPPDTYKLTATVKGFALTTTQLNIQLSSTANFDFHLALSSVSQTVDVAAAPGAVQLNTTDHQVDSVLESKSIENLPAAGRNVFQTLQSLPNVAPFQNAPGPINNFKTTTNSLSIGGSASGNTTFLQDGVTNKRC